MIQRPASIRRVVSGLVLATVPLALAGCGLETKDYTSKEHATVQAASEQLGGVAIRNAFITSALNANGKFQPYLVVSLVNDGQQADTLNGIDSSLGPVTLTGGDPVSGGVQLQPGVPVLIADPAIDSTDPSAGITTRTAPTVGTTASVTFSFAVAGQTKPVAVPIVASSNTLTATKSVPTDVATPPVEDAPHSSD